MRDYSTMPQVFQDAPKLEPRAQPRLIVPIPDSSPSHARSSTLSGNHKGHLNLDTFSPVNQNGSFEFDRVLKSGRVHRRVKKKGAWKPSWKPAYIVLRPNLLSIYKSDDETGLSASVTLNDVTAVAQVKKAKPENVFGVFTPAKNFYFQGLSDTDMQDWVQKIRVEAGADLLDEFTLPSPRLAPGLAEMRGYDTTSGEEDNARPRSSRSCGGWQETTGPRSRSSTVQKSTSHTNEYSGNEMTSYSDFSDVPSSLPNNMASPGPKSSILTPIASGQKLRPSTARNASQMSGFDVNADPERVIRHGWLLCLRSKGGVKSWKSLWVVLRARAISFYKDGDEYSASKVVPMSSIINAADIDPVSKNKTFCFQIIVEDKTYRLCAADEDDLAKWLGALKSVLAKRGTAPAQVSGA